ncbi:hypothetical protein DPMN_124485 [Dreissena polymorpha]|uniref:Uncharacterized protein n=1 Tax=Dreissena polymorpha TaxID=45954 RepID=A0A9D4JS75_DREPO|nr:hypothetical protein DPMN_124485 [Dreissena polymorpha]
MGVVVVFVFYRVHRDCLPYGHRPQKDVLVGYGGYCTIQETPRSRGDPGSFSARCIAPSTLHLGLTSHAKDELVG